MTRPKMQQQTDWPYKDMATVKPKMNRFLVLVNNLTIVKNYILIKTG